MSGHLPESNRDPLKSRFFPLLMLLQGVIQCFTKTSICFLTQQNTA